MNYYLTGFISPVGDQWRVTLTFGVDDTILRRMKSPGLYDSKRQAELALKNKIDTLMKEYKFEDLFNSLRKGWHL